MTNRSERQGLDAEVRAIVTAMLSAKWFPGRDALLSQASTLTVTGGRLTMLELQTETACLGAPNVNDGPISTVATVLGNDNAELGELLLWVENGRISSLEYAWWSDLAPDSLPTADELRI